ncbi:50S ribosomal protein L6 [Candidatus Pacearchaeota archaeon]|nr:50S ribosomal protein L6 [Candidatus Pacearchaeota archaeon]
MNKDLERVIEIPEGVEVVVSGKEFIVKGNGKELKKSFDLGKIGVEIKDGKVVLNAKGATKREAKMMGTVEAHLKNMIKGLGEDFVYELEICNVHFPMNVKIEGGDVVVKSFLGETTVRKAKILENVKVDIAGIKISVSSHDIEAAGQTAANLEKATRLTGRDRRIFQDGIFITAKPGRVI